jgi:addiction module HigA family antidote
VKNPLRDKDGQLSLLPLIQGNAVNAEMHMTRPPIHPGEILGDELREIGISANQLARQLKVPQNRISQIIAGKRAITGDTALRLRALVPQ